MTTQDVYLSLGGNEDHSLILLQKAFAFLSTQQTVSNLKISHYYLTEPLEVDSARWFVNAACAFSTHLSCDAVFDMTCAIEKQLGKVPKSKKGDRPIDIDLLFYGQHLYKDQELEIPHPRWKERLFVLMPLADLTKDIFLHNEEGLEHYCVQTLD